MFTSTAGLLHLFMLQGIRNDFDALQRGLCPVFKILERDLEDYPLLLEREEFGDSFLPTPSVLEGFSSARAAKEFSLRILLLKVFGTRRLGGAGFEGSGRDLLQLVGGQNIRACVNENPKTGARRVFNSDKMNEWACRAIRGRPTRRIVERQTQV